MLRLAIDECAHGHLVNGLRRSGQDIDFVLVRDELGEEAARRGEARNEAALVENLKLLFRSDATVRIVQQLLEMLT